jgi:Spy/CpxP family protein refolding chaperone
MNANRWKNLTLAAILVLGVGAGILVDRFVLLPSVTGDAVRPRPTHEERGRRFRDRLKQELDLTAEQEARLEEVLTRNHETAERFWSDSRAQFDELRKAFRQDIREVLTEAQQVTFDRMLAEYDEKRRNHDERR